MINYNNCFPLCSLISSRKHLFVPVVLNFTPMDQRNKQNLATRKKCTTKAENLKVAIGSKQICSTLYCIYYLWHKEILCVLSIADRRVDKKTKSTWCTQWTRCTALHSVSLTFGPKCPSWPRRAIFSSQCPVNCFSITGSQYALNFNPQETY